MNEEKPKAPLSGLVYGEIIYWGTLFGSFVAIVGSILSFVTTQNYMNAGKLLAVTLSNHNVAGIWQQMGKPVPKHHWYLDVLMTGNGMSEFGIAIGVFVVIPAIFGAAIMLFRERLYMYAVMAVIAGAITFLSMIGTTLPLMTK